MLNQFSRKNHVLVTHFPIVSAIIWIIIGIYLPTTSAATIVEPFYDSNPDLARTVLFILVDIIALVSLFIFDKWFSPEYESSLGGKGLLYGFAITLPLIFFIIAYKIFKIVMGYEIYQSLDMESILMGARPGFGEEAFFRGIVVAMLLRKFRSEKNIWFPAVFTGVVFGLTHLTNITSLADIADMWLNVVFAAVFGVAFGVIFTLCGNIWPCIFLHTLYDALAVSVTLPDDYPMAATYFEVGAYVVIMIIYLFVLMKHKEKAVALWNDKWKRVC